MTQMRTYVFMALETSGMSEDGNNGTKITNLSMTAVKREHLLDTPNGKSPRVQNKLTLSFNPCRLVLHPDGTRMTGLSNNLLEYEAKFDNDSFELINNFLCILTEPVCLIAQNRNNSDYPVLKNHLEKLNVNFTIDVRCADCSFGFHDIFEEKTNSVADGTPLTDHNNISIVDFNINRSKVFKGYMNASTSTINFNCNIDSVAGSESLVYNSTKKISSKVNSPISDTYQENLKDFISDDIFDCIFSNESEYTRKINETTPKRQIIVPRACNLKRVRKCFEWSKESMPDDSYKLGEIYKRQLNREAPKAHRADNECIMTLEIAVTVAVQFVKWVDNNNMAFKDVKAMEIGVKL